MLGNLWGGMEVATEIKINNSTVNVLLTIGNKIHLVAMDKEKLDAVSVLVRLSTSGVIDTGKTQKELNEFLGYGG